MTIITTQQIAQRLSKSFNVKPLTRIEGTTAMHAKDTRTTAMLPFNGLTLICGCYSLGEDLDNCEYQRLHSNN